MMGRVKSIQARLLTWECTMTFDEIPALETLESLFESEFPRTCRRLQENGGFYRIWHMVSFNSSEGRRSRFLVALVGEPLEKCSGRVLPEQIWLSAVADQIIRALPESDNAGNYLCYAHAEGRLFVFVFFEGRLCHWSEEAVEMEKALPRFRRFLQRDALFSRVGHFEELHLQGESGPDFVRAQFKKASRDSFWRRRDLQRVEMNEKNGLERWPEMLHFLRRKRFWLMAVVLMTLLGRWLKEEPFLNAENPVPVELSLPPEWMAPEEPREKSSKVVPVKDVALSKCKLPDFFLKGVVAEKLAVVNFASESGETRALSVGDSLETFVLRTVGREGVKLVCGDSVVEKKVGVREP